MLVFTKITCSSYFVVSPHPSNCATMKGKGTNIRGHIIKSNAHVQGRYTNAHAYEDTNTHLHKWTYNFITNSSPNLSIHSKWKVKCLDNTSWNLPTI